MRAIRHITLDVIPALQRAISLSWIWRGLRCPLCPRSPSKLMSMPVSTTQLAFVEAVETCLNFSSTLDCYCFEILARANPVTHVSIPLQLGCLRIRLSEARILIANTVLIWLYPLPSPHCFSGVASWTSGLAPTKECPAYSRHSLTRQATCAGSKELGTQSDFIPTPSLLSWQLGQADHLPDKIRSDLFHPTASYFHTESFIMSW